MKSTTSFRIGIGHDSHRLVSGGPLRLGGIDIPFNRHLDGHSDADVVLHALTDALLGALALGDIGDLFPNDDAQNRGRDSSEFLLAAHDQVRAAGYQISNLDCTVFAEQPKLGTYKTVISQRIAQLLGIDAGQVSIKAKTGEGVGPVGLGETIEAHCVALLVRIPE